MTADATEVIPLVVTGLVAGLTGGMLGFGGAIVVIPVLTLLLHRDQHLAQAVSMIVNIFVAAPALWYHHRNRAVRWDVVVRVLPVSMVLIVAGVEVGDRVSGELLRRLFGGFLVYLVVINVLRLSRQRVEGEATALRTGFGPTAVAGGTTGFLAGLLGIGGGPVAVPLLHRLCRLDVRQSIAAGSAIVCLISIVGAARKNAALPTLADPAGVPLSIAESLWLAACMAPTAAVGALMGAELTHRLPQEGVRAVLLLVLMWAGVQMMA